MASENAAIAAAIEQAGTGVADPWPYSPEKWKSWEPPSFSVAMNRKPGVDITLNDLRAYVSRLIEAGAPPTAVIHGTDWSPLYLVCEWTDGGKLDG